MPERSLIGGFPSLTGAPELTSPASAVRVGPVSKDRGWIESPVYDVALFALSPLAGLLIILVDRLSHWGHAA
jgi:hypothetical protein